MRLSSVDGNAVFYMRNKGGTIWLRDIATGQEKKICSGAADFELSADGQSLAVMFFDIYKGTTSLKVLPSSGGQAREILKLQMPEWMSAIAWFPDARHLIFARGRRDLIDQPHELWKISTLDGKPYDLQAKSEYVYDLRVHPDGRRIAIWAGIDSSEVWVMENFLPPLKPH